VAQEAEGRTRRLIKYKIEFRRGRREAAFLFAGATIEQCASGTQQTSEASMSAFRDKADISRVSAAGATFAVAQIVKTLSGNHKTEPVQSL
jgi:hypothetical protein